MVPDHVWFELPILLAPGHLRVVHIILDSDDYRVRVEVGLERVGHVDRKRDLPTVVRCDEPTVDPHRGRIVNRSEVKEMAFV